jgi:hypothetical protein|tara:strand:+ start:1038 stop:1796 length:759 start_codon:yes stop_codon:yes gene_type:complete
MEEENEPVDEPIEDIVVDTGEQEELPDDSGVRIVMSGQEYEVPAAVAEAINAERQGMDRKLGETSEELGELRKYQRDSVSQGIARQITSDDKPAGYDYETAIYEDANAAIAHLKNEMRQELRQEYSQDQTQRESGAKFWDNFYREHRDLGRSDIRADVQSRIMSELAKYQHLPDNAATRARMADDTRAYYLGIAKNFGNNGAGDNNNYSEGAGNRSAYGSIGKKEEGFERLTTTQILKKNRAKKHQALIDNK